MKGRDREDAGEGIGKRFLLQSARTISEDYLPKLREAVGLLSDQEVWERPGSASNSLGNLLLHLAGNVRQHVIAGVGGSPDTRDRPGEFAAGGGQSGGRSKAELLDLLTRAVEEAAATLRSLDPSLLLEKRVIQGKEVLILEDIFRVVEHFAYHAGQIIFAVKARKDHGFPWYKHLEPKRER